MCTPVLHFHQPGKHAHGSNSLPDGSLGGSQCGHDMDVSSGSEAAAAAPSKPGKKAHKAHLTEEEMEAALAAKGASKARAWLDAGFGGYKQVRGGAVAGVRTAA